eukprot:SAG11_NODE_8819_length_973_cov_1.306636_2_plen_24_part_01
MEVVEERDRLRLGESVFLLADVRA